MKYYLRRNVRINIVVVFFIILIKAISVLWNVIMIFQFQAIIDMDWDKFLFYTVVELIMAASCDILSSIQNFFQSKAILQMNNQLRQDIGCSLLAKNHKQYHEKDTGWYLSHFTDYVTQIEQKAWLPFYSLIGEIVTVILSMIALVAIHWSLLLTSLFTASVICLVPRLAQSEIKRMSAHCAKEQAEAVTKLKDILTGYDVLMFFDKRKLFLDNISRTSKQIEEPKCNQAVKQKNIENLLDMLAFFLQVVNLILIGWLSVNGIIIQSAMSGCGNLCSSVYNGFRRISNLRLSLTAAAPYFDIISTHEFGNDVSEISLPGLQNGITIENVSFQYDEKKPILVNVNAQFKKGGKYALTGPSGCGKSTLLKIILGWLPDYQGKVLFDNQNMRDYTPKQLQQQMSYIEQDVFLFNTTIRENITLGENFTDAQMEKALRDSALAGDLANMPQGLDTLVGEDGSALSGGQKQRVAIARALIHNRSILLIDEGTSALDAKNADIVEKSLLSNPDLTLILISHHLSDERKAQFDHVYELSPASAAI